MRVTISFFLGILSSFICWNLFSVKASNAESLYEISTVAFKMRDGGICMFYRDLFYEPSLGSGFVFIDRNGKFLSLEVLPGEFNSSDELDLNLYFNREKCFLVSGNSKSVYILDLEEKKSSIDNIESMDSYNFTPIYKSVGINKPIVQKVERAYWY